MTAHPAPILTALDLAASVDIAGGDAPLAISVAAGGSAPIDYVVLEFDRGVTGPGGLAAFAHVDDGPGQDWASGPVTATLSVDRRAEPGPVTISRVWVWDTAGRSATYDADQLEERGLDTGFSITGGTVDEAAPILTGLDLSGGVDVSSGAGALAATVTADDDTEVAAVELVFDTPLAGPEGVRGAWLIRPEGGQSFEGGPVTASIALTDDNASGSVQITGARVWDIHGKSTTYLAADLASAGLDTGFQITGGAPDTEAPELLNLVLPEAIDISGGATTLSLALSARDATGIAWAQVYLDRPVAGLLHDWYSFYLAPAAGQTWQTGTLTRAFSVAGDAVPGPVGIRSVHVFDSLGNGRIYDRADLDALGAATTFAVTDGAAGPSLQLEAVVGEDAVALSLLNLGPALASPQVDLDLTMRADGLGDAVIEQGPRGTLTIGETTDGALRSFDLSADLAGDLATGAPALTITLPVTAAGHLSAMRATAAVDGTATAVALPPDLVVGTAAPEALAGTPAAEALFGQGGDDTLEGGDGDTLHGGAGDDVFATAPGGGAVTLADFEDGADRIDLSAFVRDAALAALAATGPAPARLVLPDGTDISLPGLTQDGLTADDALLAPPPREGAVWIAQSVTVGDAPVTVAHGWRFAAPVAFAGPPGEADGPGAAPGEEPVAVRLHAVTPTSVTLSLDRPAYMAAAPAPRKVTLVVAEAGTHRLSDGTLVQAGTLATDKLTPEGFERIDYAERFATAPAALAQVQTANDPAFVVTRQFGADETGLRVALQEEEAELQGAHGTETIGWLAVAPGPGLAAGPGGAAARFEAGRTGPVVTEAGARHDFAAPYDTAPGLAAAISSFVGPDTVMPRLAGRDATGFDIRADEEQSLDLETVHDGETVDYLAHDLTDGQAAAAGAALAPIGEVHRVTLTGAAETIQLSRAYDTPVVVAQGVSFNGPDPATVRLTHVAPDRVSLRVQEPNYLDDQHIEEQATVLVMEAGRHVLPDGTAIEAGLHATGRLSTQGFDSIRFEAPFAERPVVLSTVMTDDGPDWVVTRHDAVAADGFRLALQEEEALNGGVHIAESVGWVAMAPGRGAWSGLEWEAGRADGIDSAGTRHDFAQPFGAAPAVVANLATFRGGDPAAPRLSGLDGAGFTGWAQEEASLDPETGHVGEALDYLAFMGEGPLHGFTRAPVIAEAGTLSLAHVPVDIALGHRFEAPVVFAAVTTTNGAQDVAVRVDALGPDSLTLALQEPLALDGTHVLEEVSWLVVEAGTWRLADGTRLEAGTAGVAGRGPAGLTDVSFSAPFDARPVTLAQVQAVPEPDFLDTRQQGASVAGFQVTIEGEEGANGGAQLPQDVGWLAVDPGTGLWETAEGAVAFEAGRTGPVVSDAPATQAFAAPFDATPLLLAQIAGYADPDPAVLRVAGLGPDGADLRLQEDQSADTETAHAGEDVAFVGLGGGGLLLGTPWEG